MKCHVGFIGKELKKTFSYVTTSNGHEGEVAKMGEHIVKVTSPSIGSLRQWVKCYIILHFIFRHVYILLLFL